MHTMNVVQVKNQGNKRRQVEEFMKKEYPNVKINEIILDESTTQMSVFYVYGEKEE